MNKIKEGLLWIWQLPQNICGLVYKYMFKDNRVPAPETKESKSVNAKTYFHKFGGSVTLGQYIFIDRFISNINSTVKHECGHVKQSRILGPLYLIIIGIPSILHAALNQYIGCCTKNGIYNYYHFYTEKWANKLMGIK